jgi:hypothetical protein
VKAGRRSGGHARAAAGWEREGGDEMRAREATGRHRRSDGWPVDLRSGV